MDTTMQTKTYHVELGAPRTLSYSQKYMNRTKPSPMTWRLLDTYSTREDAEIAMNAWLEIHPAHTLRIRAYQTK